MTLNVNVTSSISEVYIKMNTFQGLTSEPHVLL